MTREGYIKLAREELFFPPAPEGFEGHLSFETPLTLEQALLAVESKPEDDAVSEARRTVGEAALKRIGALEARERRVREWSAAMRKEYLRIMAEHERNGDDHPVRVVQTLDILDSLDAALDSEDPT